MDKLEQKLAENSGYMSCLNQLISYISEVKKGTGIAPTALEINDHFIKPKIKEAADTIEKIAKESYKSASA